MIFYSSEYSHPGHHRRENEDAVYSDVRSGLWCVADGMGGHQQGRMASQFLVDMVAVLPASYSLDVRVEALETKIFSLNEQLVNKAKQLSVDSLGKKQIIGCTFVILLSDGVNCTCLWAGDSRLYLLRANNLYQISDDHTVVNDLLARGVITPEQSVDHPQAHVVTRALGASAQVKLEKKTFQLNVNDRYLLCSDGLHNELEAKDISSALAMPQSSQSCRVLMDKVLQGDARDNLTACVIGVHN